MTKKLIFLVFLSLVLVVTACAQESNESNVTNNTNNTNNTSNSNSASEYDFPQKPIRVITPYGAGGPTDMANRILVDAANQHLPNDMVFTVENMPGGGAIIGVSYLANAEPDGYTIGTVAGSPMMAPLTEDVEYEIPGSFEGIKVMYEAAQTLHVHKNAPYQTFEEWLEWVKEHPGEFRYGLASLDGSQRLVMEALSEEEGLELVPVVYDGEAGARAALLGEHVEGIVANVGGTAASIEAGDLIPILNVSEVSNDVLADVPMIKDLGYDFSARILNGLVAPAGIPQERKQIIFDAIKKGYDDPETERRMEEQGMIRVDINLEEHDQAMQEIYDFNKDMLIKLGFEVNE